MPALTEVDRKVLSRSAIVDACVSPDELMMTTTNGRGKASSSKKINLVSLDFLGLSGRPELKVGVLGI